MFYRDNPNDYPDNTAPVAVRVLVLLGLIGLWVGAVALTTDWRTTALAFFAGLLLVPGTRMSFQEKG